MDGISRAALLEIALLGLISLALPACAAEGAEHDASGSGKSYDEGEGLGDGACADICGTPSCGRCPPATLVDAGGFSIDATEVRNGQYAALLEVDFDAAVVPAGCEWKSGFEPEDWADDLDPNLPVVNVDWCDASVFCAWTGKRLCGAIGGGPANWKLGDDAETDQWYRACSKAGEDPFPYGTAYSASSCNGREAEVGALAPVASMLGCEGGLPGLFDMRCPHQVPAARRLTPQR